jgi:hypothetical protein
MKDIERMKKAREEKERVKKFTERGIHLNQSSSRAGLHQSSSSQNRSSIMGPQSSS